MVGVNNLVSDAHQKAMHGKVNGTAQVSGDVDRPPHSYIALISMAILSKTDRKILLNEIYDWVIHNFPYYQFRTDKSWRNSIRHNLSLNECFIKVGKAGNGRGYYWSIHAANMTDFKKGDFRRRQARLRAKHDKTGASNKSSAQITDKESVNIKQQEALTSKMNNIETNSSVMTNGNSPALTNPTSLNDDPSKLSKASVQPNLSYYDSYYQSYNSNLNSSSAAANLNSVPKCYDYQTNLINQTFVNSSNNSSSNINLINSQEYLDQTKNYSTNNGFNMPYGNQAYVLNSNNNNTQQQSPNPFNYLNNQKQANNGITNCFNYSYSQQYTDGYNPSFVETETDAKYGMPNNNQYSDNSLLMKASPTSSQLNSSSNKYSSSSLSTSPSSSSPTSSTSSTSTNYYYNSYSTQNQLPVTPMSSVSSSSSSPILNNQLSTQTNNQYSSIGSTFPWIQNSTSQINQTGIANNFLETFSSATACPAYDSSFSYNHRI